MHILVTYDVATDSPAGRKRLRRTAQACLNFGQRVQKSVFECSVNEMQYEELTRRLLKIIDEEEDSLRIYRLAQPGAPMNVLQELGGWESEEMVRRYAHLSKPQILEHAELVSNVFIGTNLAHPKKKEARENL